MRRKLGLIAFAALLATQTANAQTAKRDQANLSIGSQSALGIMLEVYAKGAAFMASHVLVLDTTPFVYPEGDADGLRLIQTSSVNRWRELSWPSDMRDTVWDDILTYPASASTFDAHLLDENAH
ncbi:MAG: hypothetical protein JO019_05000 [Candidatus Kaiserbacteria bacterium]|nr:hypothetical protein [Candidatus Kaiserbacteria bacterium]